MKLLTKAILKRFEQVGEQDIPDPIVITKFFGGGRATWFATAYKPETRVFFGYVSLFGDHNDEWGYFSLDELKTIKFPPFGLGIERDMYWTETKASEVPLINKKS